jgi:hypothetical protein
VGPGYSGPVIATTLPCDPCIAKATVECLIGLTPYGDAYGWAKCLWSGSTGSSEALEDCLTAPLPGPVGCAWGYLRCKCKGDLLSVPGCVRDLVRGLFDPAGDPRGLGDGTSTAGDALDYFAALTYPSFELLRVIVDDTDGRWLDAGARPYTDAWYAAFGNRVRKDSDAGILVSETEAAELRAMAVGGGLTTPDFEHAIERWNRSIANWRAGVFEVSELPVGGDPNFLTQSTLRRIAGNLLAAEAKAKESGYDTPEDAFRATLNADADEAPSGGICARVKLRLEQEAVLTRDAFRATLELDNNGASRLENVSVDVIVLNEAGQIATDRFGIRFEGSTTLSGVDGAGILPGNSTGTARWTLIPTVDAAPETTTRFLVGGTLRYRLDGTDVVVDMTPVPILVHPSPRLSLQYFHQRDVFSDDPFTDELEPAVPYSLGVLVRNRGFGPAKNFRITSAQPKIIENEKGLLIDFNIVATELFAPGGFHELTPSLTVSFGDLSPGESAVGRWLMVSSLQGLFIDYTATWEHIDGMGNPRLSLIDDLSIHEMIRTVRAGGLWEDGRPDFLVNDIPDARDRPDTLYQSNGTTNRVEVVEQASVSGTVGPGNLAVTLTASMPAAWVYLRVPDPGQGRYRLARVVRSDGTVLSANTNVWITDRTFIGLARRPIPESILHLLDYNSTGQYTLEYSDEGSGWVDDVAPTSAVEALPASVMPWFQVRWAGRDQGRLGETASGLASYDVFVSEEGGPFVPWLTRTKLVSVTYLGEFGRRYAFYSVATDGAGNREEAPATADAQTVADRVNAPPTIVLPASVSTEEGGASGPDGPGRRPGWRGAAPHVRAPPRASAGHVHRLTDGSPELADRRIGRRNHPDDQPGGHRQRVSEPERHRRCPGGRSRSEPASDRRRRSPGSPVRRTDSVPRIAAAGERPGCRRRQPRAGRCLVGDRERRVRAPGRGLDQLPPADGQRRRRSLHVRHRRRHVPGHRGRGGDGRGTERRRIPQHSRHQRRARRRGPPPVGGSAGSDLRGSTRHPADRTDLDDDRDRHGGRRRPFRVHSRHPAPRRRLLPRRPRRNDRTGPPGASMSRRPRTEPRIAMFTSRIRTGAGSGLGSRTAASAGCRRTSVPPASEVGRNHGHGGKGGSVRGAGTAVAEASRAGNARSGRDGRGPTARGSASHKSERRPFRTGYGTAASVLATLAVGMGALCACGQVFEYPIGQVVPDGVASGLASVRGVTGVAPGARVSVGLTLSGVGPGMLNGDLFATLSHEDAAGVVDGYVVLLNRPGKRAGDDEGYRDNGLSVTFGADAALPDVHSYRLELTGSHSTPLGAALTGRWAPDRREVDPALVLDVDPRGRSLEVFEGVDPSAGRWVLFVSDLLAGGQARLDAWSLEFTPLVPVGPRVVGRHVFYNQSVFDGDDPGANALDDHAIAPDKAALVPCSPATFGNYTSYHRGLNGVMIDIAELPGAPTPADFVFRVGNGPPSSGWSPGPVPTSVTVRAGAGVDGSDRVTLVWGADAVKRQWLEITVLATANTGLARPDLFYFGNAIGETGNTSANAMVTAADALRVLQNVSASAPITSRFDINRDGKVGAADRLRVLGNLSVLAPLVLLDLSCEPAAAAAVAGIRGIRTTAEVAPAPALTALRIAGEGMNARWVSQGWPVTVWTTEDLVAGTWEPLEEALPAPPAGEPMEFLLPIDPDSPHRFFRFESVPAR